MREPIRGFHYLTLKDSVADIVFLILRCGMTSDAGALYGVGILVVGLGYAFPLVPDLQEQKEISEVNASAPSFFKNTHHSDGFFYGNDIYAGMEVVAGTDSVDIVVELLD